MKKIFALLLLIPLLAHGEYIFNGGSGSSDLNAIYRDGSQPPSAAVGWNSQDLTGVNHLKSSFGWLGGCTDANAILCSTSTTKYWLPPSMTTTQKNAISSPATGALVFDATLVAPQFYNGSAWTGLGGLTNPMTTLGDIIYEDVTPTAVRLAGNTTSTKKFLAQTGTGTISAVPAWSTIAATDLPNPGASSLGGIQSLAAVSHNFLDSISTSGVPHASQPASTDLSDASSLAGSGANSNITSMTGVTTSISSPTFIDYTQTTTPATPAASHDRLYFKSDNHLYLKTSGGAETQVDGGSSGANTTLSNLASQVAFNQDLAPTSDASNNIGITGSTMFRPNVITAATVSGVGDTRFIGGQSFAEFKLSGAASKPTMYLYDGAGGTAALYASSGSLFSDFGGSQGKGGLDAQGYFIQGGFGRFGQSNSGSWKALQIFGAIAVALPQVIATNANTTITNGTSRVLLAIGATGQTQTLTMPATVDDGMIVTVDVDHATAYASLTVSPNSGQTMDTTFSAQVVAASTHLQWWYRASNTTWYKDYN